MSCGFPHVVCLPILAAALLSLGAPQAAEAQYFGRNKVQYQSFRFEVLETEHFTIHFYPEEREPAMHLARMAERWYTRLSTLFGVDLSSKQPVIVYASNPEFHQTNVIASQIGEGTGGVTEGYKRRIVLPFAGSLAETDHVLGHELVHAFQYDAAAKHRNDSSGANLGQLPLWFVEGMAEYVSVGHVDPHTAMWIRDASREGGDLPTIRQLADPKFFPYRWGQALWAYVGGRLGDAAVGRIFDDAVRTGDAIAALEAATGLSHKELTERWHEAIQAHHGPVLADRQRASTWARRLTTDQTRRSSLAVSPALSPDGRRLVYLSERDLLSIDMFLVDAESGRVIRKLVDTAVDPHFTSIQFIASAGSWHPNGRQFVFGAVRDGRPELAIVDVDTGERVREVPFAELGEILNPAYAPDGRSIVFSAMVGGQSDLFVYDLDKSALRRLTNDVYADLQPAWSPDGLRIAFVTDRFSTDLTRLAAGRLGLALVDAATARIEALPTLAAGKSINPQWAPDGLKLYFLSDAEGVTDLYVLEVGAKRVLRASRLDAGASGITALSPALSAALDANRVAFSAYEEGRIGVYVVEARRLADGVAVEDVAAAAVPTPAILPPATRTRPEIPALLANAALGLPAAPAANAATPYRSGLSLDFVGQPYLTAGVNRFGATYGGGLAFSFSDMLGNHNLLAAVDVNSYGMGASDILENAGGMMAYTNLASRWNWGVSGGQVPYVIGGFASGIATSGGQPVLLEQTIIQRQTYRGVNSAVAYPVSRTTRIEFAGGYQQVTFDQQVRTVTTSLSTGQRIADDRQRTTLAEGLHLGSASTAFVVDSSVLGPVSPVAGQRSRFEVSPTVGTLSFTSALADYRRYVMPAPFYTVAGRLLHYGRYGSGSEDTRLLPLFMGYPDLVRGYSIGSFSADECAAGPSGSCEAFDRLIGSRMMVANLEFRFPLLRPFGVRDRMYGPLPTEVAFFTDAGVAWTRADSPTFAGGGREPVASAGITFRTSLFGFAVAQIDFARPFQRPGRGWVWSFGLSPGF